jgi:hypothetical protein
LRRKESVMKTLRVLAISLLAVTAIVGFVSATEAVNPIQACADTHGNPYVPCTYGTSRVVTDGSPATPLYAIMFKDARKAETLGNDWNRYFGPYALDASLYVRPTDKPEGTWKKATYHRPKNIEEAKRWAENNEAFYEEAYGTSSSLPTPFSSLAPEELAKIDYVVAYLDGTMKIYLKSSVDEKSATALFQILTDLYPVKSF